MYKDANLRFFYADSMDDLNRKLQNVYGLHVLVSAKTVPIIKSVYYKGARRYACIVRELTEITTKDDTETPIDTEMPKAPLDDKYIMHVIALNAQGEEELSNQLKLIQIPKFSGFCDLAATPCNGSKMQYSFIMCPNSMMVYPPMENTEPLTLRHDIIATSNLQEVYNFMADTQNNTLAFDMYVKGGELCFTCIKIHHTP